VAIVFVDLGITAAVQTVVAVASAARDPIAIARFDVSVIRLVAARRQSLKSLARVVERFAGLRKRDPADPRRTGDTVDFELNVHDAASFHRCHPGVFDDSRSSCFTVDNVLASRVPTGESGWGKETPLETRLSLFGFTRTVRNSEGAFESERPGGAILALRRSERTCCHGHFVPGLAPTPAEDRVGEGGVIQAFFRHPLIVLFQNIGRCDRGAQESSIEVWSISEKTVD